MTREVLPQRRPAVTFNFKFGATRGPHVCTLGFYDDGRIGEAFVDSGKSGEQIEAIASDGAVLLSIAIQHQVDPTAFAKAMARDANGAPQTIIGAMVDALIGVLQEDGV